MTQIVLNHFEHNNVICTKSGLLKTLKYYYSHELALSGRKVHIHDVIPTSFMYQKIHIASRPIKTIRNTKILYKNSISSKGKNSTKRKSLRNTARKMSGS